MTREVSINKSSEMFSAKVTASIYVYIEQDCNFVASKLSRKAFPLRCLLELSAPVYYPKAVLRILAYLSRSV